MTVTVRSNWPCGDDPPTGTPPQEQNASHCSLVLKPNDQDKLPVRLQQLHRSESRDSAPVNFTAGSACKS
jgi:hypothetical protein